MVDRKFSSRVGRADQNFAPVKVVWAIPLLIVFLTHFDCAQGAIPGNYPHWLANVNALPVVEVE